jgi:hypothetical protein
MPQNINQPQSLATELAELRDRIDALERADRLTNASIRGGSLVALNTAFNRIGEFGSLVGGGHGIAINNAGTLNSLFIVQDATGWAIPGVPQPWRKTTDSALINAAAFTSAYRTNIADLVGDVITTAVVTTQPAGVTGELRLNLVGVGTTAVKTLPAGANTVTIFRWLHGGTLSGVAAQLDLEVRRTAGAADITVFEPDPILVRSGLLVTGETSGGVFS